MDGQKFYNYVLTGTCPKCGQTNSIRRTVPDENPERGRLKIKTQCDPDWEGGCGHKWIEVYELVNVYEVEWKD